MRKKIIISILCIGLLMLIIKFFISFGNALPVATHIIFHPGASLKQENGRTNVLLLGIGGGNHDGPNLTDTIILASINWQKDTVTLISIPRDLWVPSIPQAVKKINEAYNLGGLSTGEKVVEEVTGQPVDYGIRLDFQGFVKGIDQIGGVDVNVARNLDDYHYPISGEEDNVCEHTQEDLQAFVATSPAELEQWDFFPCRYKHLHFDAGQQHMDGETALEFARSRHGAGVEGSDFARSARQQLVIEAVRGKLISSALLSPGKVIGLYDIIKSSIDTDITDTDLGLFLDRLSALKSAKIVSVVLDLGDYTTGRAGLLTLAPILPEYDNLSVEVPRKGNGDFTEIQKFITCELMSGSCSIPISPTPNK